MHHYVSYGLCLPEIMCWAAHTSFWCMWLTGRIRWALNRAVTKFSCHSLSLQSLDYLSDKSFSGQLLPSYESLTNVFHPMKPLVQLQRVIVLTHSESLYILLSRILLGLKKERKSKLGKTHGTLWILTIEVICISLFHFFMDNILCCVYFCFTLMLHLDIFCIRKCRMSCIYTTLDLMEEWL